MSDGALAETLVEVVALEPLFHRTELGTSRGHFDAVTAPDFWEVGASGTVYDRETVWRTLETRYAADAPDDWETSDFALRPLSHDVFLLTYRLRQGDRVTRRATLWERHGRTWRAIYHQGTHV